MHEELFYSSRVYDLEYSNPSKWWKQIKSLSGQNKKQEWYH
jgi:heat shock protein HspQ